MTNEVENAQNDYFHVHHMIPKFSDYFPDLEEFKEDPEFKVRLTVEGHACQHDILYRVFGRYEDFLASRALAGQMNFDEAKIEAMRLGGRKGGSRGKGKKRPEQAKHIHHATRASALVGRKYMRKNWTKELWEDIESRLVTGEFFWGAKDVMKKHDVTQATVSCIVSHIKNGKSFEDIC